MRFAILFALCAGFLPMSVRATEEPAHTVLVKEGKLEIRQYAPTIVAEVEVTGDMRRAGNSGFRPLAEYIFGSNTTQSEIAMTAPVTRQPTTKIAMTAPVTRIENADQSWTVAFIMPAEFTMETLPLPNNPDVMIREVPSELIAATRFSGRARASTNRDKQAILEAWITKQGYVAVGVPRYAGYNSPYVPGPFRRNEVMIPVTKAD